MQPYCGSGIRWQAALTHYTFCSLVNTAKAWMLFVTFGNDGNTAYTRGTGVAWFSTGSDRDIRRQTSSDCHLQQSMSLIEDETYQASIPLHQTVYSRCLSVCHVRGERTERGRPVHEGAGRLRVQQAG
eukprot:452338-Rhodomonas_salina.1